MSSGTVDEVELLTFFESEPIPRDAGEAWIFNSLIYQVSQGDLHLKFEISPSYKDVGIQSSCSGQKVYDFYGSVLDVKYVQDKKTETLEIFLLEDSSIELFLKPKILIQQKDQLRPPE